MRVACGSAIVAFVLLRLVAPASACKCAPCDWCDDWSRYDAVFDGVVVDIDGDVRERNHPVRFAVNRAWRGIAAPEVVVYTAGTRGSCGFPFRKGERYLVLAYRTPTGRLSTGTCGGTGHLSAEEAARLPRPRLSVVREGGGRGCATCSSARGGATGLFTLGLLVAALRLGAAAHRRAKFPSRRPRLRG
jgi:hypothetical protein